MRALGPHRALYCLVTTRLPLKIATAVYRHENGDDGGASGDHADVNDVAAAPGGPNSFQLADIEARSPIAGLYVRLERIFARQVWESHASSNVNVNEKLERPRLWRRLRGVLSQAALLACARPGEELSRQDVTCRICIHAPHPSQDRLESGGRREPPPPIPLC